MVSLAWIDTEADVYFYRSVEFRRVGFDGEGESLSERVYLTSLNLFGEFTEVLAAALDKWTSDRLRAALGVRFGFFALR